MFLLEDKGRPYLLLLLSRLQLGLLLFSLLLSILLRLFLGGLYESVRTWGGYTAFQTYLLVSSRLVSSILSLSLSFHRPKMRIEKLFSAMIKNGRT